MSKPDLGIIGGGQLGSLLASAAKKLNIKTVILSDDKDAPAINFADEFIYGDYQDINIINNFLEKVDLVTYEFENIPYDILKKINKTKSVLPSPEINKLIQNRMTEKEFLNKNNITTTQFVSIKDLDDIKINDRLMPGLLKTCTLGYDGKGQYKIINANDLNEDFDFSKGYILEKIVNLKKEISVVVTRFGHQKYEIYDPIENYHEDQILKHSKIPADISDEIKNKEEPRIGDRFEDNGSELEQPTAIARDIKKLYETIFTLKNSLKIGKFLVRNNDLRHIVRRVFITEKYPYSEIQDNTIGSKLVPIDMLRLKLSFFGAVKFDPRSDKWLRICMFQGAPLPNELNSFNQYWIYN